MNHKLFNKYVIKKACANLVLIAICTVIVSVALRDLQRVSIRNQFKSDSEQVLSQVAETLEKNRSDIELMQKIYHDLNQSTIGDLEQVLSAGFYQDEMANATPEEQSAILAEMVDRSEVPYLFIMTPEGIVVAAPDTSFIGKDLVKEGLLSQANLDWLIDDSEDGDCMIETNETGSYYFHSDWIDGADGRLYLILGTDASILTTQFESLTDVSRLIENIVVGDNGFVFAVDKSNNSFIYFRDENGELTGLNAIESGLTETALVDGYIGEQKINGTEYYCYSKDCGDLTIAVAASDMEALYDSGCFSWQWSIAGFISIALLCLIYASFVRNDYLFREKETEKKRICSLRGQEIYFNKTIFRRIRPVILLGVITIFIVSFYSGTLISINNAVSDSNVAINDLENNFKEAENTKSIIRDYYNTQYLEKAKLLAYLFEENPEPLNQGLNKEYYTYDEDNIRQHEKDDEGNPLQAASNSSLLQTYCDNNGIKSIYLFDEQGRTLATNQDDWYFRLSFNEEDQSYPFRAVLDQQKDYYIQEMTEDEAGRTSQYIGTSFDYYTTTDENGKTVYVSRHDYENYKEHKNDEDWTGNPVTKHKSLLQIGLNTDTVNSLLASTDYEYLIKKSAVENTYLILFDDSEDHTVLYSPRAESIDKKAADIGLNENAFSGNYIGFQKANDIEYLIDIQYYEGYYIGTAVLKSNLFTFRFLTALITAAFGLLFILIMSLLITLSSDKEEKIYSEYNAAVNDIQDRIMFMISTPTGEQSVTEKAVSRWDNKNIPWREKTPEQKLALIFFIVMALGIFNILLFTYMVDTGKVNDTIISYIISGNWDKGFNVFAYTACGLVFTFAIVAAQLLNLPVRLVTHIFGTKSETIGHLLASVIKYAVTIYSVFYCLYLLGINSTSLLTSAGILSLVIGLGSQSLIKDVVAGIFIIFEGSFRVGDIVTINDYRGQVLDVGIRTTKIMAADHNIKIINNNDVNGVINMTRVASVCSIDVPISIGIPMDDVEEILNRELPPIKDRVEGILDGPYYNGVLSFDQSKIMIQISVLCKERHIVEVRSGLNKEVLEILQNNKLS